MSTIIKIRPATEADRQAISAVLLSTFEHTWKPQLNRTGLAKAKDFPVRCQHYLDEYISSIYVATHTDQPQGMIHWIDDFVVALHVTAKAQGLGIGSRLLQFAIDNIGKSHRRVRLETDTFNLQSRAFYKKHGFAEIKHYADEEWDSDLTTILLEKQI